MDLNGIFLCLQIASLTVGGAYTIYQGSRPARQRAEIQWLFGLMEGSKDTALRAAVESTYRAELTRYLARKGMPWGVLKLPLVFVVIFPIVLGLILYYDLDYARQPPYLFVALAGVAIATSCFAQLEAWRDWRGEAAIALFDNKESPDSTRLIRGHPLSFKPRLTNYVDALSVYLFAATVAFGVAWQATPSIEVRNTASALNGFLSVILALRVSLFVSAKARTPNAT